MPLLSNATPYSILHNEDVDYSSMRSFGCLCYASTLSAKRSKFDPRAVACVFIGYPPGVKGYRLYDLQKNKVFLSRDVIFLDDSYPFHDKNNNDDIQINNMFSDFVLPCSASGFIHSALENSSTATPHEHYSVGDLHDEVSPLDFDHGDINNTNILMDGISEAEVHNAAEIVSTDHEKATAFVPDAPSATEVNNSTNTTSSL